VEFAVSGRHDLDNMITYHAENARLLGEQLGLPSDVLDSLGAAYEQWDGRGWPGNLGGDEIPVAARICQVAEHVEVAHRIGGPTSARRLVRKRRGKQFDPALASIVAEDAELMLAGLDDVSSWDAVVDAEPALAVMLSAERFDDALLAIGSFV